MKISWFLITIFIISLIYRLYPLTKNHPLWVDEYSSVVQANIYLKTWPETFYQKQYDIEPNNYIFHMLTAVMVGIFGASESLVRILPAFFGAFVPILVFIYAKKVFSKDVAIYSSLLTAFSYFQLTWSTQARGYTLQEFLILLSQIYVLHLQSKTDISKKALAGLLLVCVMGFLTHTSFILNIGVIIIFLISSLISKKNISRKTIFILVSALIIAVLFWIPRIVMTIKMNILSVHNNLWYYHALLWRKETAITLLMLLGILTLQKKQLIQGLLPLVSMFVYSCFFIFMYGPYSSKYFILIFPFITIFAGKAIEKITYSAKYPLLLGLLITMGIIVNGNTFSITPKSYYSPNHQMRDIAVINYQSIYEIIKNKSRLTKEKVAVIETWRDRAWYYLGLDYQPLYIFRWQPSKNTINGLLASSDYKLINGEKYQNNSGNPATKLILEVSDIKNVVSKYPYGFIFIDDTSLPTDVIEYAQANFTKELYLDHYAFDDNPYSIWPATLYSWGFEVAESEPVLQ